MLAEGIWISLAVQPAVRNDATEAVRKLTASYEFGCQWECESADWISPR